MMEHWFHINNMLAAYAAEHTHFDGGKDRSCVERAKEFCMKKSIWKPAGIIALVAVIGLCLAGCGGGNPKALAKQTYDIGQQVLGALFNPAKAAKLEKKAAGIEKKVAKLSEKNKAVYNEELARLSGKGLGGLFKAAGDALNNVDAEDAQKALDTAQDAVDTAKKAADALKSFGF
jgi:hypothetical protein